MKEGKMGHKGYKQGDMSPHVEDIQRPMKDYPEHNFSKTTSYVERHNAYEGKESARVKKQDYKGRYS
jgi:hypothetical protein